MPYVTTTDKTEIFYKDWGTGRPVVFSHGRPLNADAWDPQAHAVASAGYRAIAHDRRGHGRSAQPWQGNDMNTYADDLATLIDELDLRDAVLVGHSTGGGEVARYIGRHGTSRTLRWAGPAGSPRSGASTAAPRRGARPWTPSRPSSSPTCRRSWPPDPPDERLPYTPLPRRPTT
ncbi:alpha/beta hydrolase (plasmid) [Embleya sp. NBC_00888]|uniref:alpha/beta fold hydrolase n=1 Tax=Embleya sp. NBC_00888 TaxID=2975960 RepID=UPI002F9098F6|nr:alpha/beta hydrolase [Embleya sp. NBC_00888]